MSVAGYEIGRSCSFETLIDITEEIFGVFLATGVTVIVSILAAFWTFRHSAANLISCVMGCSPGGMSLMTLMAEEDSRVDMNVVVVAQTLRLFCVVVSVPFLAMQMLDETSAAVALEKPDEWHWLALIPIRFAGRFIGKKLHLPTKQLLGPILTAALFATLIHPLGKAPHELMSMAQLNIGLYIGTKLDKDRLPALRPMIPNLLLGNAAMIISSVLMAIFLSQTYGFTLITAMCIAGLAQGANVPLILSISAVQVADDKFCVAVRD